MAGWDESLQAGVIGLCDITEIEYLYSARSQADRARTLNLLTALFPSIPMPEGVYDRAHDVQDVLTKRGLHRSAGPVDLLTAATAEMSSLILLHQDHGFETVAKVTGQPTRWLTRTD